ncbi:OLC1v1023464C1 [Oldenlandia corymbosa var. corymbosa]|uniref:OLC1v1023464C1 n=1 Tax=Oldenlandia corymbosa var. corymbosa TaxID=529605 RepID=A0AAV1C0R0_OLDCO|nr:OLC1v1023464C1 [Oldenlandia corymbosa var. corymbosa]
MLPPIPDICMKSTISIVFRKFSLRNGVAYQRFLQRAHLHQNSLLQPITPQALIDLLQESKRVQSISAIKEVHALAITIGPSSADPVVLHNSIISKYASLGEFVGARHLFNRMPDRSVVSYNCMIKACFSDGNLQEGWKLFADMRNNGFYPTERTICGLFSSDGTSLCQGLQLLSLTVKSGFLCMGPFVGTALLVNYSGFLSGFVGNSCLELGEQVHGLVMKFGFKDSTLVSKSLINMYAKCGEICLTEKCFNEVAAKDIVSWNTMIGVMAKSKRPEKGFVTFLRMCEDGTIPNETTFVSVLSSCSRLRNPSFGEFVHAKVIKRGAESDIYVGSALVDFYGKCDKSELAHLCFDEISHKNSVSWNSLMASYANKDSSIPFLLLEEMVQLGYRPNEFSFSTLLKSSLALEVQQLHSFIIKTGYDDNETGQYEKTQDLFSVLEERDIVSWNILIAACARNGDYTEAFELVNHMLRAKIIPDSYTFASPFSICSKLNNLALGNSLHHHSKDWNQLL